MEIRDATDDDHDAIREVARDTWHATYDELDAEMIDETVAEWYADDELESAIEGWYADGGLAIELDALETEFLVAEVDGEVVGFTHGIVQGEEGDVLRMYVHPDHQGEGIGSALHERLCDRLEEAEIERIRALDLASNDAARAFYQSHGFEETDEGTVRIDDEEYEEAVYTLDL